MSDTLMLTPPSVALRVAHDAVNDLFDADLGSDTDEELLDSYRELERLSCRLAAVEHAFIAQLEARSIPFEAGAKSTGAFLRHLLRLHC